jgi:phage recombination protein Bet
MEKALDKTNKKNALQLMASRLDVTPEALRQTLMKTAFRECKSNEEFVSAVIVANTYQLNPILKEMYMFPAKGGGVCPIVSIDGWISLVNRQKNFNGVELIENFGEENESGTTLTSVTAKFYLKDREHPVLVTEYMDECFNGTKEPWKKWPKRMLRHKAYIQGARVAFGFSGIYDPDEAERIEEGTSASTQEILMPKAKTVEEQLPKNEQPPKEEVVVDDSMAANPEEPVDDSLVCEGCGNGITEKVKDFSIKKFKKPLCFDCQKVWEK